MGVVGAVGIGRTSCGEVRGGSDAGAGGCGCEWDEPTEGSVGRLSSGHDDGCSSEQYGSIRVDRCCCCSDAVMRVARSAEVCS